MTETHSFKRRDFVKGLGVAALGAAAMGVAGCAPQGKGAGDEGSSTPASVNLANTGDIEWERETDVLVVGSGVAGYAAAVAATDNGAEALVCEQYNGAGGASGGCQIFYSWGSTALDLPQKFEGITDDADQMYEAVMACGSNLADPELTRALVDNCADTIDFLVENGCEFEPELKPVEGREGQGAYKTAQAGGAPFALKEVFEGRGGETLLETKMTDFIVDGDSGRVVGAWFEDKKGNQLAIKARRAVIMCTGLWLHDTDMILKEWPTIDQDLLEANTESGSKGIPFGPFMGDHIKAGQRIGANMRHMSYMNSEPYHSTMDLQELVIATEGLTREPDEFHVNLNGVRFYDESKTRGQMAEDIYAQPESTYLVIYDGKWIPGKMLPFATEDDMNNWAEQGYMVKADTFEELAAGMARVWGMDEQVALNTILTYNSYCEAGEDPEFGKPKNFLTPLDTPPYWVSPKQTAHVQMTLGGYDADVDGHVRHVNGENIPGLYAAGLCTGGHFGKDAIMGTYQMTAATFGRLAGIAAAAEEAWA